MITFYDVSKSHVNQVSSINNQSYMYYGIVRCYSRKHVNVQSMLLVHKHRIHH